MAERVDSLVDIILKQGNKERMWHRRIIRGFLFALGWGQCRYCIHLKGARILQGQPIHQATRRTFLIQEGTCAVAAESNIKHVLNYEDIRKFHRCPGFTDSMFTWKGFELDSEKLKDVLHRRRAAWETFLAWGGWIVAVLALMRNW